jgi:hypothetical protein
MNQTATNEPRGPISEQTLHRLRAGKCRMAENDFRRLNGEQLQRVLEKERSALSFS